MPWRLVPETLPSYQFSSTLRINVILSPWGPDEEQSLKISCTLTHTHTENEYQVDTEGGEATPHLSEGHLYNCVPCEVEAGEGLPVFQHLYWDAFLWLGFLCGWEELQT